MIFTALTNVTRQRARLKKLVFVLRCEAALLLFLCSVNFGHVKGDTLKTEPFVYPQDEMAVYSFIGLHC